MKKLKMLLVVGLVAVLVTGCGGSNDNDTSDKSIPVIGLDSDVTVFDATIENNATALELVNVQSEGLYRLDEDNNGILGLAEKVEISDDELVHTFTLRDTKWSNGEAVTADDFVFAFRRLFDNEIDSINNRFFTFKGLLGLENADAIDAGEKDVETLGVKAIDEKTLELTLQDPCPIIEQILAYPSFFPLNEEFVTEAGAEYGTSPSKTLGCGAFTLTDWKSGSSITFEKNDGYYDADAIKSDGLEFKISEEATPRALSYETGELDWAPSMTGDLIEQYQDDDGLTQYLQSYVSYLSPNQKVAGLENANLRKAMALAIDKDALTEDVLRDGSQAANYIVPKGLASGSDGVDFRESVGKEYLTLDKELAKEYYEKAKEELGQDTFTYTLMTGERDPNKAVAEFIKDQLESTLDGFTLEIDIQPSKTFYDRANNKDFEILSIMWGPDYAYPTTYTDLWADEGPNNYANYKSERYAELQVATSTGDLLSDPEARWEAFKEMEQLLIEEDAAIIPMFQRGWAGLINPKLKGITFHSSGVKFNYRDAHIED